jgi:WD40 repeat protein
LKRQSLIYELDWESDGTVEDLGFSLDGHPWVLESTDQGLVRRDLLSPQQSPEVFRVQGGVAAATFSQPGKCLAVASTNRQLFVSELKGGSPEQRISCAVRTNIERLAFCRDGTQLAAADSEGCVFLWKNGAEAPLGRELGKHERYPPELDFTPDG